MGQGALGDPTSQYVAQGVDDLARRMGAGPTAGPSRRNQRLQARPLRIAQNRTSRLSVVEHGGAAAVEALNTAIVEVRRAIAWPMSSRLVDALRHV